MSFGLSAGTIGLIGAGASIAGGLMGASAAGDAADAQAQAAAASDATQRYMYDTTRADNAPFLANGTAATNSLAYKLGLPGQTAKFANPAAEAEVARITATGVDPATARAQVSAGWGGPAADPEFGGLSRNFTADDLSKDTVYNSGLQFGLDEGRKGIERQAAASGSSLSGATLKALTRFGNDYGSTKAGDAYNRFTNNQTTEYNRLAGVAGSGQTASAQVGSAGATAAGNISQSQQAVGNARAAGYIGTANALGGGLTGGVNAYQNNTLLNRLYPGGGSGIGGSSLGSSGFGTGSAFGNQDYGQFI